MRTAPEASFFASDHASGSKASSPTSARHEASSNDSAGEASIARRAEEDVHPSDRGHARERDASTRDAAKRDANAEMNPRGGKRRAKSERRDPPRDVVVVADEARRARVSRTKAVPTDYQVLLRRDMRHHA